MPAIAAAILTGGHSCRMGRDKALLQFGPSTLIERVITAVTPVADELLLITRQSDDFADLGLPTHADLHPDLGPLGGLYTALKKSSATALFLLPCDLPFITSDFLRFLLRQLDDHQAVIPHNAQGLQPLCAVYTPACLPAIEAALAADRLSIRALQDDIDAHILPADEWRHLDPQELLFMNINTPADYEHARQIALDQV